MQARKSICHWVEKDTDHAVDCIALTAGLAICSSNEQIESLRAISSLLNDISENVRGLGTRYPKH
jgi:hypothetical protein